MIIKSCLPLMLLLFVRRIQFSTAGFAESPSQIVSLPLMPNDVAVFRCRHMSQNADILWRVNESIPNQFPEIRTGDINEDGTVVNTLSIPARSEFSGTEVVCRASIDGSPPVIEMTDPVKLLILTVQLERVANLILNGSTVSWDAPSSPDLTGIDPDIVYCVEVYNITCGRRDLIVSDCNITEPMYTSDGVALDGYIYTYKITPRSNVEGARNGTSETIEDRFIHLIESAMGQNLVAQMKDNLVMATVFLDTIGKSVNTFVLPVSYSTTLTSLDGLDNYEGFITTNLTGNSERSITLVLTSLPFRRVWNASILAYSCVQHSLVHNGIEIGTHDIYNILVVSLSGVVTVTGDIINGSMSRGILIIAYSLTEETNTRYNLTTFLPDQLRVNTTCLLKGLPAGLYQISIFVIEESGLPFSRAAATPKSVRVDVEEQPVFISISYALQSTSTGACITCTFLDNSTTDCLVVVHRRISQLSSSGLMNIVSSHKFNRSGGTAYGCIEGVNLQEYQIGVIGGMLVGQEKDGSGLQPGVIAAIIILAILVLVGFIPLLSLILAYTVNRKRKDKRDSYNTADTDSYCTVSKQKTSKEEEANLDNFDEVGVHSAFEPPESQEGSKTGLVYMCTKQVGPRSRVLQNKESKAEYGVEGEYDVIHPGTTKHTQEEREVNEYDVVQRDESEHKTEETEQYDDIMVQGRDKSKQYAEVGATPSPRLMVRLDDDKVIYSDVQSPAVEQESQEGADSAVVRSGADGESTAGHDTETITWETVSAFSSYQNPTDVSELVALMEGGSHVSNEPPCEVRVSQCCSKVLQHKDLILPGFKTTMNPFQNMYIGQTMQARHSEKTGLQ